MAIQFKIRKRTNIFTDQRAKTILEVLGMSMCALCPGSESDCMFLAGAMRVVKYFSYEIPFLKRKSSASVPTAVMY